MKIVNIKELFEFKPGTLVVEVQGISSANTAKLFALTMVTAAPTEAMRKDDMGRDIVYLDPLVHHAIPDLTTEDSWAIKQTLVPITISAENLSNRRFMVLEQTDLTQLFSKLMMAGHNTMQALTHSEQKPCA